MSAKPTGGNGHSRLEDGGGDLRRYLLGQMSEGEEARVEQAYLASDGALEELRAREDELIEDYLAGALEPTERDRFERLFLASPARLERLLFLRSLRDRAAEPQATPSAPVRPEGSWVRMAADSRGGGDGRAPRRAGTRHPAPALPGLAPAPSAGRAAVPEPGLPQVHTPPRHPVSLRLVAPAVRGAGQVPLLEPGPAAQVALEAPLDPRDGFASHRGRVVAPDGSEAFVSPWQPNRGEAVLRVVLPSSALRDGRHVLVVEGSTRTSEEPVESYAFRVRRR